MLDLYLKFDDRDQAETVLAELGIIAEDGVMPVDGLSADGTRFDLDVVFGTGIIRKETGETIETDFGPVAVTEPVAGYHINVKWRGEMIPDCLVPFHRVPASPAVCFA